MHWRNRLPLPLPVHPHGRRHLPYFGKSPSTLKSTVTPFSSRTGVTLANLMAERESATTEMPAMPKAVSRSTLLS